MQRAWDDAICGSRMQNLLVATLGVHRARLLAIAPGSGSWLPVLPAANLGHRLSSQEVRVAIGLRLGADLVTGHTCTCGAPVLPNGHHGLSCRRSAGRQTRHHAVKDILLRSFRSLGIPAILVPPGLIRGDGKRPDGSTLMRWFNIF